LVWLIPRRRDTGKKSSLRLVREDPQLKDQSRCSRERAPNTASGILIAFLQEFFAWLVVLRR
jgi:hypothetical protein